MASCVGRHAAGRPTIRSAGASSGRCAHFACRAGLDPDRERSHRLGDLCEYYGVALDNPHNALADAAATAAILPHLLTALDIHEVDGLEPFYRPAR